MAFASSPKLCFLVLNPTLLMLRPNFAQGGEVRVFGCSVPIVLKLKAKRRFLVRLAERYKSR